MNFIFGFRVADRHDGGVKEAGGVEALLTTVIACIFHRDGRPIENLPGMRQIKAVFLQVGGTLGRRPRKVHGVLLYIFLYI